MRTFLIFFVFTLLFFSCHQINHQVVSAEFNINRLLLSDSSFVSKTGFAIYPPKNWSKTDSFSSELQKKVLYRSDNELLAIYKSDSANCALIISELPQPNYKIIKRKLNKGKYYPEQDSIWTNIQSSIFRYKTYEIIQTVFQNTELVIFKLVIQRLSELYELDYIIPRKEMQKYIQSVESSIATIN